MKRLLVIAMLVPMFSFFGCPEDLLDITFDMKLTKATFKLKPNAEAGTYPFDEVQITSNLKDEVEKNGADIDNMKSAKIKHVKLTITMPATADFSPIKSAELNIAAGSMSPIKFAEVVNNGNAVKTLDFDVADVDILDLLKETTITFSGSATTLAAVSEEVTMETEITLEIVANPIP